MPTHTAPTQPIAPIQHLAVETLGPEPLPPAYALDISASLFTIAERIGIKTAPISVHWCAPERYIAHLLQDSYQRLHRVSPTITHGMAPPHWPQRDPLPPNRTCEAAYLPKFDVIVAGRPVVPEQPYPVPGLVHALTEAILCRALHSQVERAVRRLPYETLWDVPAEICEAERRAYDKLYLLRATTLGVTQAVLEERTGLLFTRAAMHRLWGVPMATALTAQAIAFDRGLQQLVPRHALGGPGYFDLPDRAPKTEDMNAEPEA